MKKKLKNLTAPDAAMPFSKKAKRTKCTNPSPKNTIPKKQNIGWVA